MKWKTKNGINIEIKNMDTNHIKNSMKLIENNSYTIVKEYIDTGYNGDSFVPDFIKTKRKMTKNENKKHNQVYKEMFNELQTRSKLKDLKTI